MNQAVKPLVAIVGRPNVGKSTLFNRIVGQPVAIVEDKPGTTRDRLYADAEWAGRTFTLVDTGGLDPTSSDDYAVRIRAQVELAIAEADAILFLVDVREGITATDIEIAELLRRTAKPVFLVANKADNQRRRLEAVEFYRLGLGDPVPVSALHGTGIGDLLDMVLERLPAIKLEEPETAVRIAIIGRPNVGKSSLLNALLGQERAIVSEQPGTTRDAIDTLLEKDGQRFLLIDTAGIRKRGRVEPGIEQYSVLRALRAIGRADVAVLLVDASEGVTAQDTHIAGYVAESFKGLIIAVNKWDLIRAQAKRYRISHGPDYRQEYEAFVRNQFNFVDYAPVLFISAKTGLRVSQVLSTALQIKGERQKRVPTGILNQAIQEAILRHGPPSEGRRQLKIFYVTQADVEPPTMVFFVNDPGLMHFSYQRYLENTVRERFGFMGTPIKFVFRKRGE